MRIIHLGDLHFGKTLQDIQMTEADQPYWVDRFLDSVDNLKPDAVVIAGDVYDRKNPGTDAMKLFDRMVTGLAERDIYTLIIPGNHDSDIRLSHVSGLLRQQKIIIAGELNRELEHITLTDSNGLDVTFWLMPYIFPRLVADRSVLDRDDLSSYDMACRALIDVQNVDETAVNVLVAHQNVLAQGVKPEHSDSETVIGGIGEIDYTAFDRFDYVALGHIHNAQHIGRETVRYAGCPLYYDFSEVNRWKGLTVVDISGPGSIEVTLQDMPILHRMRQIQGTFQDLLEIGAGMEDKDNYYFKLIIEDKEFPSRAVEQLRNVYGRNLLEVKRADRIVENRPGHGVSGEFHSVPIDQEFEDFFQYQKGELLDGVQKSVVQLLADQQSRTGGDYLWSFDRVPEEDTEEIIELVMRKEAEL